MIRCLPARQRDLLKPGIASATRPQLMSSTPSKPAQVDRRHRERRVVEELADGLDRLASIAPQLRRRVPQDVARR